MIGHTCCAHSYIERCFKGEESVTRHLQAVVCCLAFSIGLELYIDKRCGNEYLLEGISDSTCTPNSVIYSADALFPSLVLLFLCLILKFFLTLCYRLVNLHTSVDV